MIEIKHLSKTFQMKDGAVNALKNIDLTIPDGSIYGIIGMSGAGKSTLVRCINLLERPTEGSVVIDGTAMETLSPAALRERRRDITMIFQQFNLLMQRSCLKNICFPMELAGVKKADAEKRARELLEMVGLPDKANAYPAQLSGGQKQRIAIARALATNPKVLLCDEATSALDPNTTHAILTLIKDINKKLGITVVVITHQMSVVEEICDSVAILDGGVVVEQGGGARDLRESQDGCGQAPRRPQRRQRSPRPLELCARRSCGPCYFQWFVRRKAAGGEPRCGEGHPRVCAQRRHPRSERPVLRLHAAQTSPRYRTGKAGCGLYAQPEWCDR